MDWIKLYYLAAMLVSALAAYFAYGGLVRVSAGMEAKRYGQSWLVLSWAIFLLTLGFFGASFVLVTR